MPTTIPSLNGPTLADLLHRFGAIPVGRIRMDRYPATEADVLEVHEQEGRICELVDEVLVEKAVGFQESNVAGKLIFLLELFLDQNDLGAASGPDGFLKLVPGLIRAPDVSFVSWTQFGAKKIPRVAVPRVHPDLAVEVLSEGNTDKEMELKRTEYFESGTRLVWIVDPEARTLAAYTPAAPHTPTIFGAADTISGDPVLPGFSFPLAKLFKSLAE